MYIVKGKGKQPNKPNKNKTKRHKKTGNTQRKKIIVSNGTLERESFFLKENRRGKKAVDGKPKIRMGEGGIGEEGRRGECRANALCKVIYYHKSV